MKVKRTVFLFSFWILDQLLIVLFPQSNAEQNLSDLSIVTKTF